MRAPHLLRAQHLLRKNPGNSVPTILLTITFITFIITIIIIIIIITIIIISQPLPELLLLYKNRPLPSLKINLFTSCKVDAQKMTVNVARSCL